MPIVIDCNHIINTDFTAAKGCKAMLVDFQKRGQDVHWLKPGRRRRLAAAIETKSFEKSLPLARVSFVLNSRICPTQHSVEDS